MISEPKRSRSPAGYSGLLENLVALARALADFFESRFALLAQESRVALVQLLVLAICLIVASVLVVFGYIFLIISAIVGLAPGRDPRPDHVGGRRSAFCNRTRFALDRAQPNNQAAFSRNDI
jgi:hypothetical protein